MSAQWITCEHCGVKRDISGKYTSPANRVKDQRDWILGHGSGVCRNREVAVETLGDDFDAPHEISQSTFIHPVDITELIPPLTTIPHEFGAHNPALPCNEFVDRWLCIGNPFDVYELKARKGIDGHKAMRHIAVIERSFQTNHDHKAAAMSWLTNRWFTSVTRK